MTWRIDSDLPAANVAMPRIESDGRGVTIRFTPAPHGGPEALWFCFRLLGQPEAAGDEPVTFVLEHLTTLLLGPLTDAESLRPVMRPLDGDWARLPAPEIMIAADGQVSAHWRVRVPRSGAELALCYPYGPAELQTLVNATAPYWHCDPIGVSQDGRPLHRLANTYGTIGDERPGIYVVARQHAGETPGSWVLDGFLRALAAQRAEQVIVWAVPLSNIDGIVHGDYGKDNFPYDLNRAWGQPPMRHETLVMQRDVEAWRARCRPVLALDFHAPSGVERSGVYAFVCDHHQYPQLAAATQAWCERFSAALTPRWSAAEFGRVATYRSRWETPSCTRHFWDQGVCALALETPYCMVGDQPLTRDAYGEIGARLAATVSRPMPDGR